MCLINLATKLYIVFVFLFKGLLYNSAPAYRLCRYFRKILLSVHIDAHKWLYSGLWKIWQSFGFQ